MAVTEASEDEHLSAAEVVEAIKHLPDGDLLRIRRGSMNLSFGGARSAEDLRSEAFRRAMSGTRKCPRRVSLVVFIYNVMRSIASADRKAIARNPTLSPVPNEGLGTADGFGADPRLSPEDTIVEQDNVSEIREKILDLFSDDETAQMLAEGMMDGIEGEALRELVQLDKIAFATKRRLVRRRIDAAFPHGWIRQ